MHITIDGILENNARQQISQAFALADIHAGLNIQLVKPDDSIVHQLNEGFNFANQALQKLLVLLVLRFSLF